MNSIASLDKHGETVRLILAEVSLLAEKYRYVQRHRFHTSASFRA